MIKVFPLLQIFLSLGASMVYFYTKDYRRGIYWLAAGIITTTVTF